MNATQLAKTTNGEAVEELDVLVVGAGFAGLYQLDRLRRLGYRVKVFEAGSDIGGVWYWNCYPGARVDTYGPLYQFSSVELWRDWSYSELYPSWEELRAYFRHVDQKLGLSLAEPWADTGPSAGRLMLAVLGGWLTSSAI